MLFAADNIGYASDDHPVFAPARVALQAQALAGLDLQYLDLIPVAIF
jgi:hypothetical protein